MTWKNTGIPDGVVTFFKVAVNVSAALCVGFGETVAGVSASDDAGLVGAEVQPPVLLAIL
jgi:hypothetical protein